MAVIISPKTTDKVIRMFSDVLALRKVPKQEGKFWHGNFNDKLYEGLDGLVKVLFTGYSGAVVGQAILEYGEKYLESDPRKELYFVGSVYAFKDSVLEPGDLVFVEDTYSPDSFEKMIYENAAAKGIQDISKPDPNLLARVMRIADEQGICIKPSKVYCRISPGLLPSFSKPTELMDEGMWYKVSLAGIGEGGCDSGEYESAAALSTSKLLGIPAVALMDVKDKWYSISDYVTAKEEEKRKALYSILEVIKRLVIENY